MLLGGIVADDQVGGYVLLMLSWYYHFSTCVVCAGRDGSLTRPWVSDDLERCLSWPVFFTSKFEPPKKGVRTFQAHKAVNA